MISLWYANPGEDFKILKCPDKLMILTSEQTEFSLKTLVGNTLPVVGKNDDVIYAVFAQKRFAFSKTDALKIMGDIKGKTEKPPTIMGASVSCRNDCSQCKICRKK